MNSARRIKRSSPTMVRRNVAFGNSTQSKQSVKMNIDPNTAMWIGIAILVVLAFTCTCYYNGDGGDTFANIKSGFANIIGGVGGPNLKELDIIYFMSPTCPWCQKMTKVLTDASLLESVTVVDVSQPEGQKLAAEMGASDKGIPAFISKKMKTGTIGYKASVSELVKSLNKTPPQGQPVKPPAPKMDPSEAVNKVQELEIILFVSPTCGWCNKIKTEFTEAGVLEMVEMVDVSTEDGKKVAQELLKEFRGVPASYSKKTGKSSVGYKPLPEIVAALS